MKNSIRRYSLLAVLFIMTIVSGYAQESSKVEKIVKEIVQKYEGTDGVESISVAKGSGLDIVKAMFRAQFGKSFMKGVTSITMINYADATEQTCQSIHKDLDSFISLLEEFNVSEEEAFSGNDFIRCFASPLEDTGMLSDFVIALEDGETKLLMYMAGTIKVE